MCDRLIQVSFAKIVNSKNERGGAKLRKNLLILHLLQEARHQLKYQQQLQNNIAQAKSERKDESCKNETVVAAAAADSRQSSTITYNSSCRQSTSYTEEHSTENGENVTPIQKQQPAVDKLSGQSPPIFNNNKRKFSVDSLADHSVVARKRRFSETVIVSSCEVTCS